MDRESAIITPENKPFICTRFLPKTGQTTSFAANDDGDLEKGWAIGARFVVKTISGEGIVFDRATGLMWPRDWWGAGANNGFQQNWANAVIWAAALNFAGYTDWRLPNIHELYSIADKELNAPVWYAEFQNRPAADATWSSSSRSGFPVNAWAVLNQTGAITGGRLKTGTEETIAVRAGSPW